MLFLLLIFVLIAMSLTVLLWVGTLFLQGYYYTEPTAGIAWQAPAAGAALALFLTLWCVLLVNNPGTGPSDLPYDTLFRFSPKVEMFDKPVKDLWAVKKEEKEPVHYKLDKRPVGGQVRNEYVDELSGRPWNPSGVEAIVIKKDGADIRFNPIPEEKGTGYREFVSDDGWVMRQFAQSGPTGEPYTFRWSRFLMNLFLNFFHLALWFVCLWLVLRFQWPHALGLALALWLVMTLAVLPMVLEQAAAVGRAAPASPRAAFHDMPTMSA